MQRHMGSVMRFRAALHTTRRCGIAHEPGALDVQRPRLHRRPLEGEQREAAGVAQAFLRLPPPTSAPPRTSRAPQPKAHSPPPLHTPRGCSFAHPAHPPPWNRNLGWPRPPASTLRGSDGTRTAARASSAGGAGPLLASRGAGGGGSGIMIHAALLAPPEDAASLAALGIRTALHAGLHKYYIYIA